MKSKAEAIAENILNIILDKVMWNGESPYSKLIECVNRQIATFSNLQKITCLILRNLFGLYLFSHQSCATGTLLLRK